MKITKYLMYAIGEIILVVAGILIALSVNNHNEYTKARVAEKEILTGIRDEIKKDTASINWLISYYNGRIDDIESILNGIIETKEITNQQIQRLYNAAVADRIFFYHSSHFQELKSRGVSIISNKELRNDISHLYTFIYPALAMTDNNEKSSLNSISLLYPLLIDYFEIDSFHLSKEKVFISERNILKLIHDGNFHFKLYEAKEMTSSLVSWYRNYFKHIKNTLESVEDELAQMK